MSEHRPAQEQADGPAERTDSAGDGPACRCGRARHPFDPERCTAGHPLPGFGARLSRSHGIYAAQAMPELDDAGARLVAQSIEDAGGRSELSARELADHEYRGLLHVQILKLGHALRTHGEFDKRNRLRKSWIELLDRLIGSAVAIDKTLGLGRRQKRVPTMEEYLTQHREHAELARAERESDSSSPENEPAADECGRLRTLAPHDHGDVDEEPES